MVVASQASKDAARIGLVGTGWSLGTQVPIFKSEGLQVNAVFDPDQARAESIAKENGFKEAYTDLKALIASEQVDLVHVATPVFLHAEHAIAVLEGGKHLLCEKPLAVDVEEAEKIVAAAKAHPNQVAIVDHQLRFTRLLQEAKRHISEGRIGKVNYVLVNACTPRGAGVPHTWWSERARGGGVLGAVGSHFIDTLRFVLDAEFTAVAGSLDTIATHHEGKPVTSDDFASFQLKLDSPKHKNVRGNMVLAAAGQCITKSIQIVGEEGSVAIEINNSTMTLYGPGCKEVESLKGSDDAFAITGSRALAQALQRALGPEQDPLALSMAPTVADGLAVMYVMDAMRASSDAGGKWVTPKTVAK